MKEEEEEMKEWKGGQGKEGEAMRSIGHRILPQGPATGHCAGAEFQHLQGKKEALLQWERENVQRTETESTKYAGKIC